MKQKCTAEEFIECFNKHKHKKGWTKIMAKDIGCIQMAVILRFHRLVEKSIITKDMLEGAWMSKKMQLKG